RALPEVDADRRRIERDLSWHIVSDFTHEYYQKHRLDRRLPVAGKPVHFQEQTLPAPLGEIQDAREVKFVDFDGRGRLDIAVLRDTAIEIFTRDQNDHWVKAASAAAPLPPGGYDHFLAVDLGGHLPGADFVVFGPAGVLIFEVRAEKEDQPRTLRAVDNPSLASATKNAISVVARDLN